MKSPLLRRNRLRLGICLVACAAAFPLAAQDKSLQPGINRPYQKPDLKEQVKRLEAPTRDVVKHQDAILAACRLKPGMSVADIGAGTGLFTRLFAAKVAPGGKVFAVDISKEFIEHIEKTCREQKINNVVGVVCPADSTNLAPQSVDLAFICDTYHHFEFPQKTLASIHEALRAGGRLVVVEFHKAGKMKDHVRADKEAFIKEITAAGFAMVDEARFSGEKYILSFQRAGLRPPAVPLVVHDPYFSIWSFSDRLADDWPRHWTGAIHALSSMVRIDGKPYRLMGIEPRDVPAMRQAGLEVLPTRTIYEFEAGGVRLRLAFTSPLLPHDMDLVSRPVAYLTWGAKSLDGQRHGGEIYDGNSAELLYECVSCGSRCFNSRFGLFCWDGSADLDYCISCINCRDCFGCVGLRNRQYMILNKQYSKEDYFAAAARIAALMQASGEWGEFFPADFSPFPYNRSYAQRLFPKTRAEAEAEGLLWDAREAAAPAAGIKLDRLPDAVPAADSPLLALSEHSGRPFRITSEEIRRCRALRAPLPRQCYDERMEARAVFLGGAALYRRTCPRSGRLLATIFPPDSPEIVWDKDAYESEFGG